MPTTDAISSTSGSTTAAALSDNRELTTDDFMQLMIAELTNQDPFEPMKNQDLMDQMSTITEMQSNQALSKSFDDLFDKFDGFLNRQSISDATGIIGQMVSGATPDGIPTYGKVTAVSMDGSDVFLELDNGARINYQDMTRLGGSSTEDLVGQLVMGPGPGGQYVVGQVTSVDVADGEVMLTLNGADGTTPELPFAQAVPLNNENAAALIGMFAEGSVDGNHQEGFVESVSFTNEGAILILDTGALPLENLTEVRRP